MPKKLFLVAAICYTLALAVISLVDVSGIPQLKVDHADKIVHVLAYAFLTLLWFLAVPVHDFYNRILWIGIACIIYGIIIEVLQGMLRTDRVSDLLDILANGIGVIAVMLIIYLIEKAKVKNR